MDKQLMMFEDRHEVMILTKQDVNFDFKGDFLISAKDSAAVLEYAQTTDFVSLIKSKYIYKVKNSDLAKSQNRKLNNAGELFISSFGLNQGLANSKMPKAEPFQDWLYEDMLPSISKHGAYLTPEKVEEALLDPDTIIRLATQLKQEREEKSLIETKALMLEQRVAEYEPKISYLDQILKSKKTLTTSQVAADYDLTAQALNKLLHKERVQRKVNGQWLLYQEHFGNGYTKSETIPIVRSNGEADVTLNTRWTQKGRLFIHEILKKLDIVPLSDRQ